MRLVMTLTFICHILCPHERGCANYRFNNQIPWSNVQLAIFFQHAYQNEQYVSRFRALQSSRITVPLRVLQTNFLDYERQNQFNYRCDFVLLYRYMSLFSNYNYAFRGSSNLDCQ